MIAVWIGLGWTGAALVVCALFHGAKVLILRNYPCEEVHE